MKRKYILVAAALVVLCAGAAAYSMNQNTELPSSTPNSSSAPASVASSEPESGSTSVTDNRDIANAETSLYKVYWKDNAAVKEDQEQKLVEARQGATVVEGSTLFDGLFKVYQDEEGEQFIISNCSRVYLSEDGKVPAEAMTELRLEGTGDRVYIRDTDIEVEAAKNAVNDFMRFVDGEQADYEGRTQISKQSDEVKLLMSQATAARVNNMPSAQTISVYNGYIELYFLLDAMSEMGYVSDYSAGYTTDDAGREFMEFLAKVNAVGNHFATKVLVDMETGIITEAVADGKEFKLSQSGVDENGLESEVPAPGVQISLQDLEEFYGWDIEVYADESVGEPFINIVTDNRDIAKAENFVTYQVFKEETTTGTETHTSGDGQVNVSGDVKEGSAWIKRYMSKYSVSEEEATSAYQEYASEAQQKREEAQQKRAEMNAKREAEEQAHSDAIDQWYRENTGMSRADWLKLSIDETSEWMFAHPDVDFSTSPEYQ